MLSAAFFESVTIMMREGLEAILVLAALAAYLGKIGAGNRVAALYSGAGVAVLASIASAWILEQFYGGAHNDMLEGVVILLSAGLMFYVSGWLFAKQDPRAWSAYLRSQTDRVVDGGTIWAVAALSFFAVFREGAETVLFLHALSKANGGWSVSILSGIVASSVVLAGLFVFLLSSSRKLPLRAVFLVTSGFLFLMGLRFIGQGLQEFQEQALVPYDPVPWSDTFLALGLNPTWEAILLQAAVLLVAVASIVWMRVQRPRAVVAGE